MTRSGPLIATGRTLIPTSRALILLCFNHKLPPTLRQARECLTLGGQESLYINLTSPVPLLMPLSAISKFLFLLETQGVVHSLFFSMLDSQTLASVARVSPFFEAAAIEVLYRSLDDLWPLLQLMPMDVADHPSYGFVSVVILFSFVRHQPPSLSESSGDISRPLYTIRSNCETGEAY
jgi:hypothetical protein